MSTERAKESALAKLHADLANDLADRIEHGEKAVDKATGEIVKLPASAAILNVARQFLKDNDIKTLPNGQTPAERLGEVVAKKGVSLPFEGDPKTH